jgi:hypothetical protein
MLNRMYADLLETGARDAKALGPETVRKVHRLMHRALRDEVKWGRVTISGRPQIGECPCLRYVATCRRGDTRLEATPHLTRTVSLVN